MRNCGPFSLCACEGAFIPILACGRRSLLSFRSVDSIDYKKAMLIFYEQNNLYAFKQIFIDQFEFAVREYF